MKNLTDILITAILIIIPSGGIVAYIIFSPSANTSRSQQFKRSLLSSYLIVFGLFPIFLIGDLKALPIFNYELILNMIFHLLVYFIFGGAFLTALTFVRIILLERFTKNLRT